MTAVLPLWSVVLIAILTAIGTAVVVPLLNFRLGSRKLEAEAMRQRQALEAEALHQRAALEAEAVETRAQLEAEAAKTRHQEKIEDREQARLDFGVLLAEVTKQRDEAFAKVRQHDAKFICMEMEMQGLRLSRDLDPFPNWIVDLEGRYIYVNPEFQRNFLEPDGLTYRDIIGETHTKIFPPEFASKLRLLDMKARKTADKTARMTAQLQTRSVVVHKFAICVKGAPVAFAGYITEMDAISDGD